MLNVQWTDDPEGGKYIKALITGNPGAGKTLLASTFPNPFYLTTEGLMMSLAGRNIPYHKVTSLDDIEAALHMLQFTPAQRLKAFGFPVETVVLDTVDDFADTILKQHVASEHAPAPRIQDYGWLRKTMIGITTAFRNLDMNVVFTSHLKSIEVGGFSSFSPAIEGSFHEKIAGYFDVVAVLRSELVNDTSTGTLLQKEKKFMQVAWDNQYKFLKDHSYKIPNPFELNFKDDYERIVTLIYGEVPTVSYEETAEAPPAVPEPATLSDAPAEGMFAEPEVFPTKAKAKKHLLALVGDSDAAATLWKEADADNWEKWDSENLAEAVAQSQNV